MLLTLGNYRFVPVNFLEVSKNIGITMAYPQPPKITYPSISGNGLWVQLDSYGGISTSIDNVKWNLPTQPFTSIDAFWLYNGITYGSGLFVAYGNHIAIAGTGLPGSSWTSVLNTGGNWISAAFTSNNQWFLTDSEGRTATSRDSYPANWKLTKPTIFLPPTFEFDPMSNW